MMAVDFKDPSFVYVGWEQRGGDGKPQKAQIIASRDGGRTFGGTVEVTPIRRAPPGPGRPWMRGGRPQRKQGLLLDPWVADGRSRRDEGRLRSRPKALDR